MDIKWTILEGCVDAKILKPENQEYIKLITEHSFIPFMKDNSHLFSFEEYEFINSLIDTDDINNLIIAYHIIKAK